MASAETWYVVPSHITFSQNVIPELYNECPKTVSEIIADDCDILTLGISFTRYVDIQSDR